MLLWLGYLRLLESLEGLEGLLGREMRKRTRTGTWRRMFQRARRETGTGIRRGTRNDGSRWAR